MIRHIGGVNQGPMIAIEKICHKSSINDIPPLLRNCEDNISILKITKKCRKWFTKEIRKTKGGWAFSLSYKMPRGRILSSQYIYVASNLIMTWQCRGHVACRYSIFKGPKRGYLGDMCHHSRSAMWQWWCHISDHKLEVEAYRHFVTQCTHGKVR